MGLERKLAEIGITGSLFKLYVAAIELGEAPIAKVASRAGLIRTTAYDALSRLEQEGLVRLELRRQRRYVIAQDPTVLLERLEGRRQMLHELMPQLRSMYNRAQGKPHIRFYEREEGVRLALKDILTLSSDPKLLLGILSMEELLQTPGKAEMDEFIRERVARGIWLKVIRSRQKDVGEAFWPSNPEDLRELRYCPLHMVLSMTTFIYDNRVCFISSGREHYGLIIESEEFASMQRVLFDAIWALSESSE